MLTKVTITLSEALLGFSRIILTHLDGRGIKMTSPPGKIVKFLDTVVIRGEGMPIYRRSDEKGDLYVVFEIEMPNEEWRTSVNVQVQFFSSFKHNENLLCFRLWRLFFPQNGLK